MRFCLITALTLFSGCGESGPPIPVLDPAAATQQALADFDANTDGLIAGDELLKSPGLKSATPRIDTNGDGQISSEELSKRIESYKISPIPFWSVVCTVLLDGRPLAGAKVTFVPEPFLGPALRPATGETNAQGVVVPTVDETYSGILTGLYRVQITKPGLALPAKYNEATALGQEVARDVRDTEHGVRFDLHSQ